MYFNIIIPSTERPQRTVTIKRRMAVMCDMPCSLPTESNSTCARRGTHIVGKCRSLLRILEWNEARSIQRSPTLQPSILGTTGVQLCDAEFHKSKAISTSLAWCSQSEPISQHHLFSKPFIQESTAAHKSDVGQSSQIDTSTFMLYILVSPSHLFLALPRGFWSLAYREQAATALARSTCFV